MTSFDEAEKSDRFMVSTLRTCRAAAGALLEGNCGVDKTGLNHSESSSAAA